MLFQCLIFSESGTLLPFVVVVVGAAWLDDSNLNFTLVKISRC